MISANGFNGIDIEDLNPLMAQWESAVGGNGHYYLPTSGCTWAEAESLAVQLGGHLAAITGAEEQEFLTSTFGGSWMWIGLSDEVVEDTWVWTSNEATTYTNWASGHPGGGTGYDYGLMNYGDAGRWIDADGTSVIPGLIELVAAPDPSDVETILGARNTVIQGNLIGTDATGSAALGNAHNGVYTDSADIIIGGTEPGAGNVISGNGWHGIDIYGPLATGNVIQGNQIGTNAAGTLGLGNASNGILIVNEASDNTIGGTSFGARNVISANLGDGIRVNYGSYGNTIEGNLIGTDLTGTADLGNAGSGIYVDNVADNIIGGTDPGARNVISGNDSNGVYITGSLASGNVIQGNYIGTDVTGALDRGNAADGIQILAGAHHNTVGGISAESRNVISGNQDDGIEIWGGTTTANTVVGNFIGTDASGTADLGNDRRGVRIYSGAYGNIIGGAESGAGNLISGNTWHGIYLIRAGAAGNTVLGNLIGTDVTGTQDLGNGQNGVAIDFSPNNVIGGTGSGARNVISGNGTGIAIWGDLSTGNTIQGNYIGTDLTGTQALANGLGVSMGGSQNTIGGTVAGAGNLISGNSGRGIKLNSGAEQIIIQGNYIGTNAAGDAALGNSAGIEIDNAPNNLIGGTTAAARNVISGNQWEGVIIWGPSASGNDIQGNYIGTDAGGSFAIGNGSQGVRIGDAPNNVIGGTDPGAGNLISGNSTGVAIHFAGATGNAVQGNFIGTNADGTADLGNSGDGVYLVSAAWGNLIGGSTPAARNIISGNDGDGVHINGDYNGEANNNTVQGNYIGTDVHGTADLGNAADGIRITKAWGNTIGGTASGQRNVISGNGDDGIHIDNASYGNVILGSYIGVDATGAAALGNDDNGVHIVSNAYGNTVGGVAAGAENVISANGQGGINIEDLSPLMAQWSSGEGGNGHYYLPTLSDTWAEAEAAAVQLGGHLAAITSAEEQAFLASTFGGGLMWIGLTDEAEEGTWVWTSGEATTYTNWASGEPNGGTSENYAEMNWWGAGQWNDGDSTSKFPGLIELETAPNSSVVETILGARKTLIQGNLIGTDASGTAALGNASNGVRLGYAADVLIGGTDPDAGNTIAANGAMGVLVAYSGSSGNVVQGNHIGTNVSGTGALGNAWDGVWIDAGAHDNTIGGASSGARNVISGNLDDGIQISNGSHGNTVLGNYIGTDAAGDAALGNESIGIRIEDVADITIGGTEPGAGNVISGNDSDGIFITGTLATGNLIQGNQIGTNAAGTGSLGNGGQGIKIDNARNNLIGGTTEDARNVISGNQWWGVMVSGSSSSGNDIQGNYIGTDVSGTQPLGNLWGGIWLTRAANSTIGGTDAGARNVISANVNDGIKIDSGGSSNTVQGNYIGTNAAGDAKLENGGGITIDNASNNLIGGTSEAARNVISGNQWWGVTIWGSSSSGNDIQGNYIGTDASGTQPLGNQWGGIWINGVANNTIGGIDAGARNVISANLHEGVQIDGGASGNTVQGNYIGTDVNGTADLGNGNDGVRITQAWGNVIGGTAAGERNVIAGNGNNGVEISDGSCGNTLLGNYIGTDATGSVAMGNDAPGVYIAGNAFGNTVGGTAAGAENVISANGWEGINIEDLSPLMAQWSSGSGGNGHYYLPTLACSWAEAESLAVQLGGHLAAITSAEEQGFLASTFGRTHVWIGLTDEAVEGTWAWTSGEATTYTNWTSGEPNGGTGENYVSMNWGDPGRWNDWGGTNLLPGLIELVAVPNPTVVEAILGPRDTLIQGNLIGTDATGAAALGNASNGVRLGHAADVLIGGSEPDAGNTISANGNMGVLIEYSGSSGNIVEGNYIGTNVSGTAALGNAWDGVWINAWAHDNTIGGTSSGARNIISGNLDDGIQISGGAYGNTVLGNYIGTDVTGSAVLGNSADGLHIADDSFGNTVGGVVAGAGNVISANGAEGIDIWATSPLQTQWPVADGGNGHFYLPTHGCTWAEAESLALQLGGHLAGIGSQEEQDFLASYYENRPMWIGLTDEAEEGTWVWTSGEATTYTNWASGQPDGGTGQNYALMNWGSPGPWDDNGSTAVYSGLIELAAAPDPGVVEATLGPRNLRIQGNLIGTNASGTAALGNQLTGIHIDDSADIIIGGTQSGAGNVVSGNGYSGIFIDDTLSTGIVIQGNKIGTNAAGTLGLGNAGTGIQITGEASHNTIGGTDSGARNIISGNQSSAVNIFGSNTTDNVVLGNYIGTDVTGTVALGNGEFGIQIYYEASHNTIGGTDSGARNIISGNQNSAVNISSPNTADNVVLGNYIGTDVTGTVALGNGENGIQIYWEASHNTIGGTDSGARNIISGNQNSAVQISGSNTTNNVVLGNYIGTDVTGTVGLGNGGYATVMLAWDAAGNTIGGTDPGAGNLIAASAGHGIYISSAGAAGNLVQGNYIGTNAAGTAAIPNAWRGVAISYSPNNVIGGTVAGARNIISGNNGSGVALWGDLSTGNTIQGNYIGTDVTGTLALGNAEGVDMGGSLNTIGGTATGAGNLISGNRRQGIQLTAEAQENTVQGNYIGTDLSGTQALGNQREGIWIDDAADNTIGGTVPAARNVISGNAGTGIYIEGAMANGNVISANYVGIDMSGAAALPNQGAGVSIYLGAPEHDWRAVLEPRQYDLGKHRHRDRN